MVMVEENVEKENKSGEDNESTVIRFSCAQTHTVEKVENPEVIWDSGSTIVLAKKVDAPRHQEMQGSNVFQWR